MRNGAERFLENSEPERPRLRDTPGGRALISSRQTKITCYANS